jgi:hypothetical protein
VPVDDGSGDAAADLGVRAARPAAAHPCPAQGLPTNDIGARLHLSAYTVQDHLKAIFAKTGSGSRGDLIARLFFEHYVPQLTSTSISTMDDADAVPGAE